MNTDIDISVVVPMYNEEESLPELIEWIDRVMKANNFKYEIWLVDDGSKDKSWSVAQKIRETNPSVKGLRFRRNYGKSAALNVGFEHCNGNVVITMDADLQDSPDEIPELYRMVIEDGFDMVSGWKKKRYDPIGKTLPSKFFNGTTRKISGIKLHDFNCGLKAYRKEVVKSIEVYGEMHRYIPVIAKWAGFTKIGEKVVAHRERKYGVTKFGLERFINGFLDLISISFVSRFSKKPMHFFGSIGSLMFLIGFISASVIGVEKLIATFNDELTPRVTASPYFYIALVCMIMGSQLFLTGFLAELVGRSSSTRNHYLISEKLES